MHRFPTNNSQHSESGGHQSRHTDKFHRCLGHVRGSKQKYGYGWDKGTEYAICTTSIGYSGSYTQGHRKGARTPGGRARKMAEADFSYSSTQVELPPALAAQVAAMASRIPKHHLAEPSNDVPHITVKYGLHTQHPQPVASVLKGEKPVRFRLGKTSLFKHDDYDVVKVDVESDDLHRLNAKLRNSLEVTDTFPTYKPHVTVAYVKRGLGQQYAGLKGLDGVKASADTVVFSNVDHEKTPIRLR